MNKKGSIQDIVMIIGTLFAISVVILISFKIMDSIQTKFQDVEETQGNIHVNQSMSQVRGMFPGVVDSSIMLLLVVLLVGAIGAALLTRFHPVFFVFFIIIFAILLQVSGAISDAYQEFAESEAFSTLEPELTFTHLVMRNLPWVIAISGCLLAWIMYKIWQAEEVGGF